MFQIIKLTHVCRHWRLVLISLPLLWTNFRVIRAAAKFIAKCIKWRKQLLIHISFEWFSPDADYLSPSISNSDSSVDEDDNEMDTNLEGNRYASNRAFSHSMLSVCSDHFFLFYSNIISEFLWGIQVHHRQLTTKCMGGMGRFLRILWKSKWSAKGWRRKKWTRKGKRKWGKGTLHYHLNVRGSTTQEAQGAKRGEEGEVINWQWTTKIFSLRTG